jgi:hypothetical protein
MKRWLAIALLLLLPLHSAFALAAACCGHEDAPAGHFGHHAHEHHAGQPAPAAEGGIDLDCGFCQLCAASAALVGAATVLAAATPAAPLAAPEALPPSIDLERSHPPPITFR